MIGSEQKDRLADTIALLSIQGIGRGRFRLLVKKFGSPAQALAAPKSDLMDLPGISEKTVASIKNDCEPEKARQIAARIAQLGWAVLFPDSPEYPQLLAQSSDCPPVLFRLGQACASDDKAIGIVGTRHASETGRRFAFRLASDLAAAGITVVSGMAEGIDSMAHRGALEKNGRTVAVWGTPLDKVFPASNRQLAAQITKDGAVYSEYLPGTATNASNFPERNRIISGLSEGIVVVEAGEKSGALITAKWALEHQRELFAVPGQPGDKNAVGANRLIKMGAKLLTGIDDIFDELPRLKGEISAKKFKKMPDLTDVERDLVGMLSGGPLQIDLISRQASMSPAHLLEYLLALELKGIIEELPGKRFVLTDR